MRSPDIKKNVLSRAGIIGILALLLLIPLQMVADLVEERETRQKEAVTEVSSHWGAPQQIVGPVMVIPFKRTRKDSRSRYLYVLPEKLEITGGIEPEKRSRGLYDVILYKTDNLKLSGTFKGAALKHLGYGADSLSWERARIVVALSDLRGIQKNIFLNWNRKSRRFQPGTGGFNDFSSGITAFIGDPRKKEGNHSFSCLLTLRGSTSLSLVPAGRVTRVALESSWPHPSFFGSYLPSEESISENGFKALWSVTSFGSGFPRNWVSGKGPSPAIYKKSIFGISLFQPVDVYQKVIRAVKYGILFILLTFLTFFLYDLFFSLELHPLQFMMIGFALCLFFLLFLSLSEHMPFTLSYIISSFTTIGMITGYSRTILKKKNRGTIIAALLALLYGYLYIVLVSRDYALLLGTVALMAVLAVVMYLTRNIDWYSLKGTEE